ncbi:hypothetical protein [Peptostreptococcus anaerobius]|nr:hypothetical protein [Peptostreptococcus anaerobius]MCQ5151093.1 hypothetical protein [Peptostreptococcus anaerobius]MDK8278787.1 hypothetical protein [Peptostreptococcus anaerobius]
MENVIEVRDLVKEYEKFKLSKVSFSIPNGMKEFIKVLWRGFL